MFGDLKSLRNLLTNLIPIHILYASIVVLCHAWRTLNWSERVHPKAHYLNASQKSFFGATATSVRKLSTTFTWEGSRTWQRKLRFVLVRHRSFEAMGCWMTTTSFRILIGHHQTSTFKFSINRIQTLFYSPRTSHSKDPISHYHPWDHTDFSMLLCQQ